MSRPFDLIIFDLDGVITTEQIYWECACLILWELLRTILDADTADGESLPTGEARERLLPPAIIGAVKDRAVNSNWDLTYLAACALLLACPAGAGRGAETVADLLGVLRSTPIVEVRWPEPIRELLAAAGARQDGDLLSFAGQTTAGHLGVVSSLLRPHGLWWDYLFDRFQVWLSGKQLAALGAPPLADALTLPPEVLRRTLWSLREAGYRLGIATGRPRAEALPTLRENGLLDVFDPARMVTYSEVEAAQRQTGQPGLGKPHPFAIWQAMHPGIPAERLLAQPAPGDLRALMVGDGVSDAQAARAAGIPCLGVLSGITDVQRQAQRYEALLAAGCLDVVDDVSCLPQWLRDWRP